MKTSLLFCSVLIICFIPKLDAQRSDWSSFQQAIAVSDYQGKQFRVSGAVKIIPSHKDACATFRVAIKNSAKEVVFKDYMFDRLIRQQNWSTHVIEGTINDDADTLTLGGFFYMGGKFYFDAFKLEIETIPGHWESIPLQNAGFEKWSKNKKIEGWTSDLFFPDNYSFTQSSEDVYEGEHALFIQSDDYGILNFHPINEEVVDIPFETITQNDGYTGDYITYLLQDQLGYIWIGTLGGLVRYDGYIFRKFQHDTSDSLSLSSNDCSVIYEDSHKDIWVGTTSGGLNHFDRQTETFERFMQNPDDSTSLSHNSVTAIYEDNLNNLWVGTRGGGLNCLSRKTKQFERFLYNKAPYSLQRNWVTDIVQDNKERIWVSTYGAGMALFDAKKKHFHHFYSVNTVDFLSYHIREGSIVLSIEPEKNGTFLLTTETGLLRFDPNTQQFTDAYFQSKSSTTSYRRISFLLTIPTQTPDEFWVNWDGGISRFNASTGKFMISEHNEDKPMGLSHYHSNGILEDTEKMLWAGNAIGKIDRLNPFTNQFENHKLHHIDATDISIELEDTKGWIWAVDSKGIHRFNVENGEYIFYNNELGDSNSVFSYKVATIYESSDGSIWFSLINAGLGRFDPITNSFEHIGYKGVNGLRYIRSFYEDSSGVLWLGTWEGLYQFDRKTQSVHQFPQKNEPGEPRPQDVTSIYEDQLGNIWLGMNCGLLKKYIPTDNSWEIFNPIPDEQLVKYGNSYVQQIIESKNGLLWLATAGNGILRFDPHGKIFTRLTKKNGLPSNSISAISEDGKGILWVSTPEGLSSFNPDTKKIRTYDVHDGLPSNDIYGGVKSSVDGKFYFGSTKGVFAFHPDSLKDNTVIPLIVITSLTRYNPSESDQPIPVKGIDVKKSITLSYKDDLLAIEFAALSYTKTAKNQYAYKLEGLQDEWIQLGTKRDLTLTNLPPGDYTLRIKGSNGDGYWNEKGTALQIRITPPWYWAWWSKSLYGLIILAGIIGMYRFQLTRRLATAEAQRLKELDTVKTRLYTNITHEFRTPLTIISGMADQVLDNPKQWLQEGIPMIKRNSRQLLALVNQMLDLSKLESGNLPINMIQDDILAYLKYIVESFHSLAESKQISLHTHHEADVIYMDYDPEKVLHIVSNLLSNAIKFTPEGGSIHLQTQKQLADHQEQLAILVKDTGVGIPPEQLPQIFDRFYQADDTSTRRAEGTGIGLTLTKELVKLLNGFIHVESTVGKGTTFTVVLPISKLSPRQNAMPSDVLKEELFAKVQPLDIDLSTIDEKLPLVLIVEDNQDVVQYLSTFLQAHYRLEFALNGKIGIEKAIELTPDIIISDVMMPGKDGFEVCDTLKKDERTSHIPIILLTAKADVESKIAGLQSGADAYLAKPFNKDELYVRLEKLIELRRRMQARYSTFPKLSAEKYAPVQLEDSFLLKIKNVLEQHLSDPNFEIEVLCKALGMSHSQIFRKVKALTGNSISRFVRTIRLHKAQELLRNSNLNISEIAYEVGFTSLSYFSRTFQAEFGQSPSEFRAGT